jgi:hypothetical protein
MKRLRYLLLICIPFIEMGCHTSANEKGENDSSKYVFKYTKDGKEITGELKDTLLIKEIKRMLKEGANYSKQKTKEIYDEKGNLTVKYATNIETSLYGLHYKKYTYNSFGYLTSKQNLNQNDQLINVDYDISVTEYLYDGLGNKTEERYYDKNKKPVLHGEFGYHLAKSKYNENNKLIEAKFFDTELRPIKGRAFTKFIYDERDSLAEVIDYDENNKELKREKK